MEAVLAAGEQFVDVRLVAYVPDEFVSRGAENVMQCDRQFDDTKVGTEVTAMFGQFGDQLVTDFLRQGLHLIGRQLFDVRWIINHIEVAAHIEFGCTKISSDYSGCSPASTFLSIISPAGFFSSCLILSSACSSCSWQTLTRRVPSSKRDRSVSRGRSPLSMDS